MKVIEEYKKKLERYTKPVKAEMTDEEMEILRKVFEIPGSYEALYKWFLIEDEFTKGVSLAMEVETIPTVAQGFSKEEVADNLMFIQTMTRHIRQKFDGLKQEFIRELEEKITEEEKKIEEEKLKEKEKIEAQKLEAKGVGVNL